MSERFAGKVALVTGASRGIGLAVAQRIVAEGGCVCITARKPEPLNEALDYFDDPTRAVAVAGHVDDREHRQITIDTVLDRFGSIDVLVNNAGVNPLFGPLLEADNGAMRKIVEVNLLATLAWTKSAVAVGADTVVNVASTAGLRPARGIGFYGSTKAALMHLTTQLALELAPAVRVNAVAPAVVRTQFGVPLFEGREDEVAASYPLRQLGRPDQIAAAVAYLASDEAAWTTGQTLVLDGGLSLTGGI
ncbi:SDR family oxidoreductase [uncultured Jatrophihabitans sp.]|uniref:SDR family oxidoreductase n=1 Tax=uncultured Jatrophihabitans sp. TaxID=1610747 RepID=UPI0035CC0DBD